jgi:hypothetical protein
MMRLGQDLLKALDAQRRKAGLLVVVALAGAVAGCVPALFTVNVSYPEGQRPRNNYFDRVMTGANPSESRINAGFLQRNIVSRGDNQTDRLVQIITEAGGACSKSGTFMNCEIDQRYVSSGCSRGECSSYERRWQLRISWNASIPNFTPNVNATIHLPRLLSRNV